MALSVTNFWTSELVELEVGDLVIITDQQALGVWRVTMVGPKLTCDIEPISRKADLSIHAGPAQASKLALIVKGEDLQ